MKMLCLSISLLLLIACNKATPEGEKRTATECITAIIAADDELGKTRNHACEAIPLGATIQAYVDGLKNLDYSNCPTDFQQAFQQHQQAWLELLPIVENYPEMRGEMHDLFDQLEQSSDSTVFNELVAEIWSTWSLVEQAMEKEEGTTPPH